MEKFEQEEVPLRDLASTRESPVQLKAALEGSYVYNDGESFDAEASWKDWERGRRFIASAIDKDGSLLDFGSANGLLLKSVQEWTNHKIDPYGLDIDDKAIQEARKFFPGQQNHFATPEELKQRKDFPRDFDFIYWNVWDNHAIEANDETLKQLMSRTRSGGRLILGFYDSGEKNKEKIQKLVDAGFQPSHVMENPAGGSEMIVWFDRDRGSSLGN